MGELIDFQSAQGAPSHKIIRVSEKLLVKKISMQVLFSILQTFFAAIG